MAEVLQALASAQSSTSNCDRLQILQQIAEAIPESEVPRGSVDVLISEPLGNCLLNERMLESFLYCRDRFLSSDGLMIPHAADLITAPFEDAVLYAEVCLASASRGLWGSQDVYGVDLRAALPFVEEERFRRTVVDYVNPNCLHYTPTKHTFDFRSLKPESLEHVIIDILRQHATANSQKHFALHGLCCWFDVSLGPKGHVLSTAPTAPATHWYQTRFLVRSPLQVDAGSRVGGRLEFIAHARRSYFVQLELFDESNGLMANGSLVDLRNAWYRTHCSSQAYRPPDVVGRAALQSYQNAAVCLVMLAYAVVHAEARRRFLSTPQ